MAYRTSVTRSVMYKKRLPEWRTRDGLGQSVIEGCIYTHLFLAGVLKKLSDVVPSQNTSLGVVIRFIAIGIHRESCILTGTMSRTPMILRSK